MNMDEFKPNSLSLIGAVSLGTGVMIGAGIFALLGQIAELAGSQFPSVFIVGAIVTAFSAYSYIKLSNAYPSAGGIAVYLEKAYGMGWITGVGALLMAFSMIINESLVARTFGSYTTQLFRFNAETFLVPALGVALIILAFMINISGNRNISRFAFITSSTKIIGIALFGLAGLYFANQSSVNISAPVPTTTSGGYLAAIALAILAYKGFTTITNSGSEITNPTRNVGRAIIISLLISAVIYLLVALAVASNLSLSEIIQAKDFALAKAARPVFGDYGLWFTVGLAVTATMSGIIASLFAVSRMLTMLTKMKLVPHKHFKMPGSVHSHILVYTVVIAIFLTIFFDLTRIAALGVIFYLIMDIAIHWGIFRHLRQEVEAKTWILLTAIVLDFVVLGTFLRIKYNTDPSIIYIAFFIIIGIIAVERLYLRSKASTLSTNMDMHKEK